MDEYADCPFCGSRPQRMIEGDPGYENVWVQCTSCTATAEEDMWNNRPIHDKILHELMELQTENEKLKRQFLAATEQDYCTLCGRILKENREDDI